jgi:hypothetical protein
VRFTGDATDTDGLVVGWHWDFGDGTVANDARRPTHVYARPGVYSATLTVADEDGASAQARVTVQVVSVAAVAPDLSAGLLLSAPMPDPFLFQTTLAFTLPVRALVQVRIHDVRGALVRKLYEGVAEAGEHRLEWDGRGDDGRAVGPGLYFCRLSAPNAEVSRRMVRLR